MYVNGFKVKPSQDKAPKHQGQSPRVKMKAWLYGRLKKRVFELDWRK